MSECSEGTKMKFRACQQLNGWWFSSVFKTHCFTQFTFSFVLFISGCVECLNFQQRSHCYGTWKNHLETCFLPIFCTPKLLSTPGKFQYHFPVKAKFDADMSKSRMEQNTHQYLHIQPCFKLEVTQQTLLYSRW